jgi:hypothetical protein
VAGAGLSDAEVEVRIGQRAAAGRANRSERLAALDAGAACNPR